MPYTVDAQGRKLVTLIAGDGIGPEVTTSARRILEAAHAPIAWEERAAGAAVFKAGLASGVPAETVESIRRTRVVLKGPLETPVGFGEKSANVTLRKLFETFANIRPVRELPGVRTPYSGRGLDLVIVRENVEDLYAGIEYQQTPTVAESLKLMSRLGCEKIVRLAFELARAEGRKKVHCATKANILKLTEGLLKRTFEEVSREYPEIESQHIIVDNCAHQLVKAPEQFDVIVTSNMNGDILSDEGSALVGGLGFAPSANLGNDVAIFEAVHGSAPKYAGKNVINPTALILSSVLLLRHLEEFEIARQVEEAVLVTLEEGRVPTRDVVGEAVASSTSAFTDEVIRNLGRSPARPPRRTYRPLKMPARPTLPAAPVRQYEGLDVFLETTTPPGKLGSELKALVEGTPFLLAGISNRGTRTWPETGAMTDLVDHTQVRFLLRVPVPAFPSEAFRTLLGRLEGRYPWMHLEVLQRFGTSRGYTRSQGDD
jgi:isocitrate dehydrogenase